MSTCSHPEKVRHATQADAKEAIRSMYRNGRGNPDLNVYPCGDHWHVGHSVVRFSKRIKAALNAGRARSRRRDR